MKSFKSYLLIAALSLTAVSVYGTAIIRSRSNISNNFVVECTSCNPKTTVIQPANADKNGFIVVKVDKAGTYKISAADGPKKNQVLDTITATKAGTYSLSVKLALDAKE
jgi:hypothetical protein